VVGGPYPNQGYGPKHLEVLLDTWVCMRTWEHADYVVDFLQPVVHDGCGHWVADAARDAGHPNDAGHKAMYACIDVESFLGPLPDDLVGMPDSSQQAPARLTSKHDGAPLIYRFVGQRAGAMRSAAVGWFEGDDNAVTWRSFNGDSFKQDSWSPRNTWNSLMVEVHDLLDEDSGSVVAKLQCYGTGLVTHVTFGSMVWILHDPLGVENGLTGYMYSLQGKGDNGSGQGWFEKGEVLHEVTSSIAKTVASHVTTA